MTHSQFLGGLHETGRSCISVSTVWDGSSGLIWDLTLTSRNEETGEGKHRWTDRPECVIWSVAVGHRAWICRDHRGVSRRLRPSAAALTHHQLLPPKGRPRVLDNRSLLSHTARGQAARIFDSEVDPPPAIRQSERPWKGPCGGVPTARGPVCVKLSSLLLSEITDAPGEGG